MITSEGDIETIFLEIGEAFAAHLIKNAIQTKDGLTWDISIKETLFWNNHESINAGVSGVILFLITLFQKTQNENYLYIAKRASNDLVAYCKRSSSANFSLYTGRFGVVYSLIQLYHCTRDDYFLKESLSLTKSLDLDSIDSNYVTNYLFDGRAGTLLVIFHLYKLTQEDFLLQYILLLTKRIISEAKITYNGIYWQMSNEINPKGSCGFANGSAGIGYVFLQLTSYFANSGLELIARECIDYVNNCLSGNTEYWRNYERRINDITAFDAYKNSYDNNVALKEDKNSWAKGAAGIGLFEMYKKGNRFEHIKRISNALVEACEKEEIGSLNLFEGKAGIGLFLLCAYARYKNHYFIDLSYQVAKQLIPVISKQIEITEATFHDKLGILYFCLKMINPKDEEMILCPFVNEFRRSETSNYDFSISLPEIRRLLLLKYFPKTIKLSDKAIIGPLCERELNRFINFFEERSEKMIGTPIYEVFTFEREKLNYLFAADSRGLKIYFDELLYKGKVLEFLNKSTEQLLESKVCVSDNVKVMERVLNEEQLSYIVVGHKIIDDDFDSAHLVMRPFATPMTIKNALIEIKHYCDNQPEGFLKELVRRSGSKNTIDFKKRLEFLFLYKVKELIYFNVLKIMN